MNNILRSLLTLLLAALPLQAALAIDDFLPPGEYVSAGRRGTLLIKPTVRRTQAFSIETTGGNGHACSLGGIIVRGEAGADSMGGGYCTMEISRQGEGLKVTPEATESCRAFCGAGAGFDALYLKPAAGCRGAEIRRTRDAFITLYRRKQYAQARDLLEPVMTNCERLLYDTDAADVRNDLAVTLYHLGDNDACLDVLAPLREIASTPDEELRQGYPLLMSMGYLSVAAKTRTNLKLCGATMPKRQ